MRKMAPVLSLAVILTACSSEPLVFRKLRVGMPAAEFRAAYPQAVEQEKGYSDGVHMIRYSVRPGNGVNLMECYFREHRLTGVVVFFANATRVETVVWEVSAANGKPDVDEAGRSARVVRWRKELTLFSFSEPRVMALPTGEKRRLNGVVMLLGS